MDIRRVGARVGGHHTAEVERVVADCNSAGYFTAEPGDTRGQRRSERRRKWIKSLKSVVVGRESSSEMSKQGRSVLAENIEQKSSRCFQQRSDRPAGSKANGYRGWVERRLLNPGNENTGRAVPGSRRQDVAAAGKPTQGCPDPLRVGPENQRSDAHVPLTMTAFLSGGIMRKTGIPLKRPPAPTATRPSMQS